MNQRHEEEVAKLKEEIKKTYDSTNNQEKRIEELLVEVLAYNKLLLEKLTKFTGN